MDLDVTLLFQLAIVVALMAALNRLLFTPLLAILQKRHQQTVGTLADVERLEHLAAADREAYESRMRQARRQAQGDRERLRADGREEARRVMTQARAKISAAMNATREQVDASERAAAATLQGDVATLARQLASKLLGREARA